MPRGSSASAELQTFGFHLLRTPLVLGRLLSPVLVRLRGWRRAHAQTRLPFDFFGGFESLTFSRAHKNGG